LAGPQLTFTNIQFFTRKRLSNSSSAIFKHHSAIFYNINTSCQYGFMRFEIWLIADSDLHYNSITKKMVRSIYPIFGHSLLNMVRRYQIWILPPPFLVNVTIINLESVLDGVETRLASRLNTLQFLVFLDNPYFSAPDQQGFFHCIWYYGFAAWKYLGPFC